MLWWEPASPDRALDQGRGPPGGRGQLGQGAGVDLVSGHSGCSIILGAKLFLYRIIVLCDLYNSITCRKPIFFGVSFVLKYSSPCPHDNPSCPVLTKIGSLSNDIKYEYVHLAET